MASELRFDIPPTMKRWALYGAGIENLHLEIVSTPEPAPDELLVRHDACGICYSDIKIINLGAEHPRLVGRDLSKQPVVIGHEVSVTVVKVGENLANKYEIGERFTIQVDIFYKGERLTYGYKLSGGMAQYGIIGKEILDGDEGCYLLPLKPQTNLIAAALCEPWACVIAAYRAKYRTKPKQDGLFAEFDESGLKVGDFEAPGYDDILVSGSPTSEIAEFALSKLNDGGVINFALDSGTHLNVNLDVGRIHYHGIYIAGNAGGKPRSPKAAYKWSTRRLHHWKTDTELKPDGSVLFIGAGGPMGRMHVQRAITIEKPPKLIVISDINEQRLSDCYIRFKQLAEGRNVELISILFDQKDNYSDHLKLMRIGEFDDIVSLVPSADSVSFCEGHLAMGGEVNVFAGVPVGSKASIEISSLINKNQRIIGTTGSSLADMRYTLELAENGQLDTMSSLAAVGGLDALKDGLDAVRVGKFGGKVVIFPNNLDMPLTAAPLSGR